MYLNCRRTPDAGHILPVVGRVPSLFLVGEEHGNLRCFCDNLWMTCAHEGTPDSRPAVSLGCKNMQEEEARVVAYKWHINSLVFAVCRKSCAGNCLSMKSYCPARCERKAT